jgi:hypothetical protein
MFAFLTQNCPDLDTDLKVGFRGSYSDAPISSTSIDLNTSTMRIKLESNEPGPVISSDITLAVDKKPVIVIRANEAQLTILNDSFAKTALPNSAEIDEICKETGLYVFFWYSNYIDATRRGQKNYVL